MSEVENRESIAKHRSNVDEVVTNQIYAIAERLPRVDLGEILMECRHAAIEATIQAKPELASIFINLMAELLATKQLDVVMGTVTRPSRAIRQIVSMSCADAGIS